MGYTTKQLEQIVYFEIFVILNPGASSREYGELIEEHKNKPLGQHSEALERLLYYFRRAGMNDKYIVKCDVPFKKYKIMALSGERGRSPRLVEDKIYENSSAAYHGIFLRRIQDLMEA